MLNSLKPIFTRKPKSEGDTLEAELRELAGYNPDARVPRSRSSRKGKEVVSLEGCVVGSGLIRKLNEDTFLFDDVPYNGVVLPCVERPMKWIDQGESKTQDGHCRWLSVKKNNPRGYALTPIEVEYQLARMAFDLKDNEQCGVLAEEYLSRIKPLWDTYLVCADRILPVNKDSLEVVIKTVGGFKSKPKRVVMPVFENGYFVLSNERPESDVDTIEKLSDNTKIFLKSYLGEGYDRAGIIFPYVASRRGVNLRETSLWTPLDRSIKRVGGLGVGGNGGFDVGAGGGTDYGGRALVVAVRAKNFYEKRK